MAPTGTFPLADNNLDDPERPTSTAGAAPESLEAQAQRYLDMLKRQPRSRVSAVEMLHCYDRLWTQPPPGLTVTKHLWDMLHILAERHLISLPHLFAEHDAQSSPAPPWLLVNRTPSLASVSDAQTTPWVDQMSFASRLTGESALRNALAINAYLRSTRPGRTPVPIRQRSLEIFGDERRLETLCDAAGNLFGGRLSLGALDCFPTPPPLPHTRFEAARGRPVLLAESAMTYHLLVSLNAHEPRYAAGCYTGAAQWTRQLAAGDGGARSPIDELLEDAGSKELVYLGGIDYDSLHAAPRIASYRRASRGLAPLRPSLPLYTWLLSNAPRCPAHGARVDRARLQDLAGPLQAWLGPGLASRCLEVLDVYERIPVEAAGAQVLAADLLLGPPREASAPAVSP